MLIYDLLLTVGLVLLVFAWWRVGDPRRTVFVVAAAGFCVVVATVGLIDDRWQLAPGLLVPLAVLFGVAIKHIRGAKPPSRLPWRKRAFPAS